MIKVTNELLPRVSQGDLIRNVEYVEHVREDDGIIEVSKISYPLVIVLTQDCDLEQDYAFRSDATKAQGSRLVSVLVAPLYNAEHVYTGSHLSDLDLRAESIGKKGTEGRYLQQNQRPRYHYLEFPAEAEIVPSVIDFKHYFSVHVEYLRQVKERHFVCKVGELFREDICARFADYLSRIGLPMISPDERAPDRTSQPPDPVHTSRS
jgi:hypothetical protein